MKVAAVVKEIRAALSPGESLVYSFINGSSAEVFTNRELADRLKMKEGTVRRYTRRLTRDNRIGLMKVGNRRFYGSERAIEALENGLKQRVVSR